MDAWTVIHRRYLTLCQQLGDCPQSLLLRCCCCQASCANTQPHISMGHQWKVLDEVFELSIEPSPGGSNGIFFFLAHFSLSLFCWRKTKHHPSKEHGTWRLRFFSQKAAAVKDTYAAKRHVAIMFWPWFCFLLILPGNWYGVFGFYYALQMWYLCPVYFYCISYVLQLFTLYNKNSDVLDVSWSFLFCKWSLFFSKWCIGHQSLSDGVLRISEVSCCRSE